MRGSQGSAGKGVKPAFPLPPPAACPPGSYKAKQGEGPCLPCPPNSRTATPAASLCLCYNNFYRADSDSADSACTSEPRAHHPFSTSQLGRPSHGRGWGEARAAERAGQEVTSPEAECSTVGSALLLVHRNPCPSP